MMVAPVTSPKISKFIQQTFGGCSDRILAGDLSKEEAIEAAREAVLRLHPKAESAFIHGSVTTGRFRPLSDVDVLVFTQDGDAWTRDCVELNGALLVVEAFPVSAVPLMMQFAKHTSIMMGLVLKPESIVLLDRSGNSQELLDRLVAARNEGPHPVSSEGLAELRYRITGNIMDLLTGDDAGENFAVGMALASNLIRLAQLHLGGWLHSGKWAGRRLNSERPDVVGKITHGMERLCQNDRQPLIEVAIELLDESGGGHWIGSHMGHKIADEALLMPLLRIGQGRVI